VTQSSSGSFTGFPALGFTFGDYVDPAIPLTVTLSGGESFTLTGTALLVRRRRMRVATRRP